MRGTYLCQAGNVQAGMAALRLARAQALKLHLHYEASLVRSRIDAPESA